MRRNWALLMLALVASCATPRADARQTTPTSVQGPTLIIVVAFPFGAALLGTGIDQQGDVGGSTGPQSADAKADVTANPTVTPLR